MTAAGLGWLAAWTAGASAAIEILPTQLVLPAGKTSETLTVTNGRPMPAGFEITAFAWEQRPDGEMVLLPSDEIRVSPAELRLAPHEAGHITVDLAAAPPSTAEKTWRVRIRELPDRDKAEDEEIKVLATVTLPVFQQPSTAAAAAGAVESQGLAGGHLPFTVHNTGNRHVFVERVSVTGVDTAGKTVFDIDRNGWYVLAGGQRGFQPVISRADCQRTARMIVRAQLKHGETWETPLLPVKAACGTAAKTEFPPASSLSAAPPMRK